MGFNTWYTTLPMDEKHAVVITVPSKYYSASGTITLEFHTQFNEAISNESLGIDNVKVVAKTASTCPTDPNTTPILTQHKEETVSNSNPGDTCHVVNFETDAKGNKLVGGAYIKTEWADWGVTVTASGKDGSGYTPENQARIFDTAFPGADNNNGDPDLGSPNINCVPSTKRAGVSSSTSWCCILIWSLRFTHFFVLYPFTITAQLGSGRRRRTW
jgi:hypothetical protein